MPFISWTGPSFLHEKGASSQNARVIITVWFIMGYLGVSLLSQHDFHRLRAPAARIVIKCAAFFFKVYKLILRVYKQTPFLL
jgi:hypothetical protein